MFRVLIAFAVALMSLPGYPARAADEGGTPPAESAPMTQLTIKGKLSYLARVALPRDSYVVLEVKDTSSAAGPVVARQTIELNGLQVPIPFDFTLDRGRFSAGATYSVRGAVFSAGRPMWKAGPVAIDPAAPAVDLGTVNMTRIGEEQGSRATGNEPG